MKHDLKFTRKIEHYKALSQRYQLNSFNGRISFGVLPIGVSASDYFASKADRLESDKFILSDTPGAINLLQAKIDSLNRLALFFKASNKAFKDTGTLESVRLTPYWQSIIDKNISTNNVPFTPSYFANLRRRRKFTNERIKSLKSANLFKPFAINGVSVTLNNGQIVVKFPEKPDKPMLDALKKTPIRLKWSRYQKAWVRKFTGQGEEYFKALQSVLQKGGV